MLASYWLDVDGEATTIDTMLPRLVSEFLFPPSASLCSFPDVCEMSTESVVAGSEGAAVGREEPPFSAEQLAWIDRLITARHSIPSVLPAAGDPPTPTTSGEMLFYRIKRLPVLFCLQALPPLFRFFRRSPYRAHRDIRARQLRSHGRWQPAHLRLGAASQGS